MIGRNFWSWRQPQVPVWTLQTVPQRVPGHRHLLVGTGAVQERAWTRLLEAMSLWRPVSDNHIAPVVLFVEPLLIDLITPARGRALLETPRAG